MRLKDHLLLLRWGLIALPYHLFYFGSENHNPGAYSDPFVVASAIDKNTTG